MKNHLIEERLLKCILRAGEDSSEEGLNRERMAHSHNMFGVVTEAHSHMCGVVTEVYITALVVE